MFPPLQLPQPSHAVTRATQPTGEPTAASSTSMMLSTSPATEVTSSVEALGLSADLMDSGAAPYLSAKVTNMSITTATGLASCSSSQILPRLKCNRVTCCWVFSFFSSFNFHFIARVYPKQDDYYCLLRSELVKKCHNNQIQRWLQCRNKTAAVQKDVFVSPRWSLSLGFMCSQLKYVNWNIYWRKRLPADWL